MLYASFYCLVFTQTVARAGTPTHIRPDISREIVIEVVVVHTDSTDSLLDLMINRYSERGVIPLEIADCKMH